MVWSEYQVFIVKCECHDLFPLFRYSERLGIGYQIFLNCSAGALMSTFCLLLCYTVSTATYYRIRPSLFVSHRCQEINIRKYSTNSIPGDSAEPAVLRSLPRRLHAADDRGVHGALLPLPHRHRVLRLPRPHRGLRHGIRGRGRPLY